MLVCQIWPIIREVQNIEQESKSKGKEGRNTGSGLLKELILSFGRAFENEQKEYKLPRF